MVQFDIALQGPLDLAASLEWFARWGEDLLARWDGRGLTLTAASRGRRVPFTCRVSGTRECPVLRVTVRRDEHAAAAAHAVSHLFLTDTGALERLAERDPIISRLNRRFRGTRPVLQQEPFTALIRSISAQQINLKWALTTRNRLTRAFGVRHRIEDSFVYSIDPRRVAGADADAIRALQFTTAKAKSIHAVAHAIMDHTIDVARLSELSDEAVTADLIRIPGIGTWTADWFLVRTLGRARVVAEDLGVRKAVGQAYLNGRLPQAREVRSVTAHWGTASAMAQHLLLHALAHGAL